MHLVGREAETAAPATLELLQGRLVVSLQRKQGGKKNTEVWRDGRVLVRSSARSQKKSEALKHSRDMKPLQAGSRCLVQDLGLCESAE